MQNCFFSAVEMSKTVKAREAIDGFTKGSAKWPRTLMEGMELRFCFVTSLLSWTLLRFCFSEFLRGEGFGSEDKSYLFS